MFKKSDVKDINNLTPMQEGMLFYHMMEKDNRSFAYFGQSVLLVTGPIDVMLFEKAFNKVIEKYDILRTVFLYEKVKKPVQVILKQRTARVEFRDLSLLSPDEKKGAVEVIMQQDKEKNFDLEKDILMRVIIVKTAAETYHIIWSHHHIIMDGWCLGIIVNDFSRYYNLLVQGKSVGEEVAAPYSRYLKWLDRQDRNEGLRFWQAYLEGFEKRTGVPCMKGNAEGARVSREKHRYLLAEYDLEIDEATGSNLNCLANENGVTVNHIFQVAWALLLQRYNNTHDVLFGAVVSGRPAEIEDIETMVGLFINTIPVRITFEPGETCLDLIKKNQRNSLLTRSYEYLPLAEIQARSQLKNDISDHIMVFENYPVQENIKQANREDHPGFTIKGVKTHEQSNYDFNIIVDPGKQILVRFSYNAAVYDSRFIKSAASHLKVVLDQVIRDPYQPVKEIEIIPAAEKHRLLYQFNQTGTDNLENKTIHELFAEQAARTPEKTAVCTPVNGNEMFVPGSCFKRNPFIYERELEYGGKNTLTFLKTHCHNSMVVNSDMVRLLDLFDGKQDIKSIYSQVEAVKPRFSVYPLEANDILEITWDFNRAAENYYINKFEDFVHFLESIYKKNLIVWEGVKTGKPGIDSENPAREIFHVNERGNEASFNPVQFFHRDRDLSKGQVLLLGDTPGMPTTGLLYLASYLRRNGIKACCQFYDPAGDVTSMKRNIEELLDAVKPEVVAVSLKWFLYIARVFDICKIVKSYARERSSPIKVVVGGNTASYYREKIIQNENIDYVIRGDGEEALLAICKGAADIPNCVYIKEGKVTANPITYVQDETNSSRVYLSHLDEILLSSHVSLLGTFFIYTHKGCVMNCFYCGGCSRAQQETFNRKNVLRRGIKQVRTDIRAAMAYTSTFQFDFDIPDRDLSDYWRQIWEGIDLSGHFCIISTLRIPTASQVELVAKTFKYVYWDLDVLTLSQRHRNQLFSLGLVKPQPSDKEILAFLDRCERYDNIRVRINLIIGLPYFTREDISAGEKLLAEIMHTYSCFGELHWARLHAQPGAPVIENADKYNMHSYASCYEDFLTCSEKNFTGHNQSGYPGLEHLNYPYIYFNDDELNSEITRFYYRNDKKIGEYHEKKRLEVTAQTSLSYRELNEKAGELAVELRRRGVTTGSLVGLSVSPSPGIPIGILAILKAGGAYLPIDPEFPPERATFMLNDSSATALVTEPGLLAGNENLKHWQGEIIEFSDFFKHEGSCGGSPELPPLSSSSDLSYIIYTSGTTGKPKGVMLTHENLANYVRWFTKKAQITREDKTMLTSSFAFDLGYTSIYTSLLKGGELHILTREDYLLADRLLDYIKQNEITYIKATPSLFTVLINHPGFSGAMLRGLRMAALGGEPINVKDIKKVHDLCPHISIMNHYGPTEATIGCIARYVDFRRFEEYENHPTIGKPIDNTNVYILDRDFKLMPVGVPGELCLSGTGLARGYLNRPELTEDKFFPLFPLDNGTKPHIPLKIYKTGDLARWRHDGNVEFLGRIDNQIKIRGYRIELGEIEDRLSNHNEIMEATVINRENGNGETYICAYYVPGTGETGKKRIETNPGEPLTQATIIRFAEQVEKTPGKVAILGSGVTYRELNEKSNQAAHIILETYDDRYALLKRERTRYKRQMLLDGWGIEAQEKLKSTSVYVAGAGGGASATIIQLALVGVGTIIVCDFDKVELSNLNRQFLHDQSRIGMNKALSAQITINKINPHVNVIPITERLTRENCFDQVGDSAIIFDMFDGQADKFILSECAAVKGIPHIISAMTDISSYAVIFHPPLTPCFHCLFDKTKLEELISGMKRTMTDYEKNPLPVAAPSLFVSTGFAVNEAIKIILGLKNPAYNKFFYFNQGGSGDIGSSASFRAMTYTYSEHFRRICREQGFDWDVGWRGNFLEELVLVPDPGCPVCGEKAKRKLAAPKEKLNGEIHAKPGIIVNEDRKVQTVALLTGHDVWMPVGLLGILKSGKNYVHPDPVLAEEQQLRILEDSAARLILTDKKNFSRAEKLRNTLNKNIPIIAIDEINMAVKSENLNIRVDSDKIIFTNPDAAVIPLFKALLDGDTYNPAPQEQKEHLPLSQLREYLLQSLPEYMIPSYFVQLEQMPLTPNGKVDKNALPAPGIETRDNYTAPRDRLEGKLVAIWSEILEIDKEMISIDANFFELGGHSLKAAALASYLHKECNARVPLPEIFNAPTIKGIAGYVRNASGDTYAAIEPMEKKEYYVTSSTQARMYLLQQMDPGSTTYNIPGIIPLEEEPDREKLEEAFIKLLKRHETLRTSFEMIGKKPVQKVLEPEQVEFAIRYYDPGNRHLFIRPFDLSRAPLLRVGLVQTPENRHILLVDMHHIISDAVSQQVLARDFMALSSGAERPDLRIQYKDYCQWLNTGKMKEAIKQQEEYWLSEFAGEIPQLDLPADFERPAVQSFAGNMIRFALDTEETVKLKTCAAAGDATLYMVLLSIFTIFLSKISGGQEDILLGTGIAGRGHADLEEMIGMFVNTLAMRNYPKGNQTFKEFLKTVRNRTITAFENQDYPFEDLVEKLVPDRDWSRPPLVQAVFVMQNLEAEPGEISENDNQNVMQTAKFDITLVGIEAGEKLFFLFEYCTKLFKKDTIEMFILFFKSIVSSVINDIEIQLKNITFDNGLTAIKSNIIQEDERDFAF